VDELVRTKMHEALGIEQPDGGLRSRVLSSLPVDEAPGRRFRMPSFQWAGGLLAVLLAVAVVAGLLYFRNGVNPARPAGTGPVGQVTMNAQVGFRCSLPVVAYNTTFATVQLPDGVVANRSTAPGQGTAPGGKSMYGPGAYDVQAGKWLPVQQRWISPDGKSYAYGTQTTGVPGQGPTGTIHVVDVASGKDRQLWSGDGAPQVLTYLTGGIYFMKSGPTTQGSDIWVVEPANVAAAHRVGPNPPPPPPAPGKPSYGPSPYYNLIGPLGAFGQGFNMPADGPPAGAIYPDRVVRMDLATGAVSTWFVNPSGGPTTLLGLDGRGRPVVGVSKEAPPKPDPDGSVKPGAFKYIPNRVLLLTGPNQATEIAPGTDMSFMPVSVAGDTHGVWFGVPGSVWLYDSNGSLRKVFSVTESRFPAPTPPPGYPGKGTPPPGMPTPPPDMPQGPYLQVIGPCT
jgi:hypothetical protein